MAFGYGLMGVDKTKESIFFVVLLGCETCLEPPAYLFDIWCLVSIRIHAGEICRFSTVDYIINSDFILHI